MADVFGQKAWKALARRFILRWPEISRPWVASPVLLRASTQAAQGRAKKDRRSYPVPGNLTAGRSLEALRSRRRRRIFPFRLRGIFGLWARSVSGGIR